MEDSAGIDQLELDGGRNLTVDFSTSLNDVPPEFAGKPVVQLNFEVTVPRSVTA